MSDKINPLPTSTNFSELKSRGMIYHTTYKKGQILANLYFEHSGTFDEVLNDAKTYCTNHGLKHVHTVRFLIDIKEQSETEYSAK